MGPRISKNPGVKSTTRTCPRGPMGPIDLPFQRTSSPPAFPTLILATSGVVSVLVWAGCRTPENICLPSLVMDSQVSSVAERLSTRWFTPSAPVVVVTDTVGVVAGPASDDVFTGTPREDSI